MKIYRIVAVFLPNYLRMAGRGSKRLIGDGKYASFQFTRGAWRVKECYGTLDPGKPGSWAYAYRTRYGRELWTVSDRPYRKGTLFNPLRALKRALAARRHNGTT